jgi:hypothetical protein
MRRPKSTGLPLCIDATSVAWYEREMRIRGIYSNGGFQHAILCQPKTARFQALAWFNRANDATRYRIASKTSMIPIQRLRHGTLEALREVLSVPS